MHPHENPKTGSGVAGQPCKIDDGPVVIRGIANGSRGAPDDRLRDEPGIWSLACERYNLEIPGSLRAPE